MLEFSISNQLLTRLDATAVYSDSENYLECAFSFSEDWEGLAPVAVFGHADVAEPIAVPIVDGVCRVPHEVIHPYAFVLAVYGTGPDGEGGTFTHVPTNVAAVEVGEAGTARGLGVPAPTQDLYDSLMAAIREATQDAAASKVAAQAAAGQAEGAARASDAAKGQAEGYAYDARRAANDAAVSAQSALRGAGVAERAAQAAQKDMEDMSALRREMDDVLLLHKSYAMGTGEYAVVAALRGLKWAGGKASGPYLGLVPQRRYLVEVNGARYDGISRLTAVNVPLDKEEKGAVTLAAAENDEQPEPGPDEPGDEAEIGDPVYKYHTQVTLVAGPVTLVDCLSGCPTVQDECVLTTQDSAVSEVVIVTDGQDNGKYYMEEAKAARDGAQAAQTSARSAATQAKSAQKSAQSAQTAAENAAEQAKEASRPPYVGENGHWYAWDTETLGFVDSGVAAQGAVGPRGEKGETGAGVLFGPESLAAELNAGDVLFLAEEANGAVDDAWNQDPTTVKGTGALCQVEDGGLRLRSGSGNGNSSTTGASDPPAVFIDETASQALALSSGVKFLEMVFTPLTEAADSRFGVYLNYDGPGDGFFVGYDPQGWYWQVYQDGEGGWYSGTRKAAPARGTQTTLRLEWEETTLVRAVLNGEVMFQNVSFSGAAPFAHPGRVALKLGRWGTADTEARVEALTYTDQEGMV